MVDPLRDKGIDVVAVDLIERAVALRGVVAGVKKPVFARALLDVFEANLSAKGARAQEQRQ